MEGKINVVAISGLARNNKITPCGEVGEYHTLVAGGSLFKGELEIIGSEKILRDNHRFWDILSCKYRDKEV
jgi:diphthamide synthase (EF-2-diphthine--ammonia ligase)